MTNQNVGVCGSPPTQPPEPATCGKLRQRCDQVLPTSINTHAGVHQPGHVGVLPHSHILDLAGQQ